MLLLAATTDKLDLITSAAGDIDVHCSYIDLNSSTGAWVGGGKQNTTIATAATTDVMASPAATTLRNIKTINARNAHASVANTITLRFNQNATIFELHKVTLAPGECLEYIEGVGFFVLGAVNPNFAVSLASDFTNSTTTATEVSGLTTATGTGNYAFSYHIAYQTAATTTSIKFAVNYTGTVTTIVYNVYGVSATTTASDGVMDQDVSLTTGGLFNVNAGRAKATTTTLSPFVSVDTANADMYMRVEGLMIVSVAGSIALWCGSEVAASQALIKAGSGLILTKMG